MVFWFCTALVQLFYSLDGKVGGTLRASKWKNDEQD